MNLRNIFEVNMTIPHYFPRPPLNSVVEVTAVDWGTYLEQQFPAGTKFSIVYGKVYGRVIDMDNDQIVLAMQVFQDGGVRGVITIPWVTVSRIEVLKEDGSEIHEVEQNE